MNDSPTFGLLVPCRNGAGFLRRLLDSASAQSRPFDEFWFFDDGSSDDSGQLAAAAGARVLRVEKSIGPSAARNRLAAECHCDWLHFHDADDTLAPNYLARVAAAARGSMELVVCDMLWIDEATGKVDNRWRYSEADLTRHPASSLLINTIGGINGLYRRDAFLAVGGFDETLAYWEDMELNLRLFARGARCAVVNEDLVTAYRRAASYSNSNLGEVWRVKLRIMRRLLSGADGELKATIAREAETIATRLALLNGWPDVSVALSLCLDAGGDPPATRNPALRIMKRLLPRAWTFRLQHQRRVSSCQ